MQVALLLLLWVFGCGNGEDEVPDGEVNGEEVDDTEEINGEEETTDEKEEELPVTVDD